MKKTITIVDYGSGNLLSAQQSFIKVVNLIGADAEIQISNNPENLKFSSHVVLPGQGAFKTCMDGIKKITGMEEQLNEFVKVKQRPFFGICVGMQSLFATSEEGEENGFGFINAECKKFVSNSLKVPHIGWNEINQINNSVILDDVKKKLFYFAHSFHVDTQIQERYVLAKTRYSYDFPSIICKNNIYGVQFHPEKSSEQGLELIKNFIEL